MKFEFLYLCKGFFMTDIQLFEKLIALPSELKKEVSDFVDFLNMKSKKSKAVFSS